MNNIVLNKTESMFDALMNSNKTQRKSEVFIIKTLIDFLLENIQYDTHSLEYFFKKNDSKNLEIIQLFLYASRDYYINDITLSTLIDNRCDAWRFFDKATEDFKTLLNLAIYTIVT